MSADRSVEAASLGHLVWATDLDAPIAGPLGLTRYTIECDRTRFRYRVTRPDLMVPWVTVRRALDRSVVAELETAPGVLPRHWWVSGYPVPVVRAFGGGS